MIFKQQLTDISTVLNNTGNTTKLLTSFNALDIAQQKVLLSSSLLSEKQKEQCITMATLSAANTKYTAEQLAKATGISTETLANWGLIESTDALTISELAQRAASDAQAKAVLDKIIAQNAEAVANGKIIASNTALTASEGGATLATGAFTTAVKANIKAMITWMTTTPLGWLTMLVGGVFLAVKAYDALTVSVKEQKEKMEDSLSAYKDAKSELSNITTELENQEQAMDDLLAKEKLTYAEQGQLEELQAITRELRIQKDLAEKEEGRTQKEVAKDASDLFNKQFGKYDISEDAISEYQNNANITGNNAILISDKNDISSMIAGYRQFNNLLDEAYGSESQEDIDHFKSLTEDLKDSIFETAQELQEQQSNIADYYNTIKDIPYDDLTTEQKGIVDSYNSISDAIELIYQQLDSNTWKSMQIESVFDTEGIEKTKEELIEMVKAGEFDESTLQSYPKLSAALEQNKVSASELRNELEALADAEGNVKGDTFNDKYPISTFEDAWAGSFTSENSKVKELGDTLLDLAEKGRLTTEAFNEADSTAGDYFKNLDISAEEAVSKISKLVDESSQLSSMSSQISKISEVLGTKRDDKFVSADTLSGFDTEIRSLDSWDRFQEVLGSTASSYDECQEAANALATEWVNNSDFLAQLTEQNEEYYATQLKAMGIENYEEIIAYAQELNSAKGALSQASFDLATATAQEVQELINEGEYSALAQQQIWNLALAKQAASSDSLNTADDCQRLLNLAQNAGVTGDAISMLTELMGIYNNLSHGIYGTNADVLNEITTRAESIKQNILNLLSDNSSDTVELKPRIKFSPKAASSAGKSAGESFIDALDKELAALDKNLDAGYIDFDDYIQARLALIDDYYKQGKLSADEYYSYLEKHYDTQLSYMDQAVNAVTRRIDTELDALKQQKEDVENFYKAQIDSLEKEKTLLEEANRERQRQKDLQKSIYDMERAKNQRTQLVYTEGRGMHYAADDQAVRDAQENVDNARYDMQIAGIEKSVSKLEAARDRETGVIDEKISDLEAYKNAWSDVTSAYAAEQEDLIAAQILGADWETNILNGRLDILDTFKNQYISIQQAMADAARESANEQIKAAKEAEKGASGTNHARKGLNLVGEDGAEAYFDNHGHVAIVTEPTLIPMEGGEVITPARPGSLMWDLREKFNAYINRASGGISSVMAPADSVQKDMARRLGSISTVNNITNTGMRQVTIGDIHVTCPGVTSQEVARQVGVELNKQFSGLSLAALQESKK